MWQKLIARWYYRRHHIITLIIIIIITIITIIIIIIIIIMRCSSVKCTNCVWKQPRQCHQVPLCGCNCLATFTILHPFQFCFHFKCICYDFLIKTGLCKKVDFYA